MNKLGIIGAMDLEVAALKEQMNCTRRMTRAGMDFWEGTLNGTAVVIVQSGIGKVLAGICVQILADKFEVTHVINTGVAGSLNADLDIGDIVVSRDAVYHDFDVTKLGYAPGQVPGRSEVAFAADPALIDAAVESCKRVNPDIHCLVGRVASGDQFISDKTTKERIISGFAGYCAEMEGCAIAQAATANSIPFVIIRAISDKADDSAKMDYPTFEKAAAHHSALLVADLIKKFAD
ncbi:MAG: 5'-methylthioadenosine/adenosylhomocysteine nucleosidase [Lachnospiraceae bacterium]|nr:5'-methylthioadenosine/adenosylhomocysteine nucleosidase [Lachnospiraceae bacterium]